MIVITPVLALATALAYATAIAYAARTSTSEAAYAERQHMH
jgi:hypothetical protein